MVEATVSHIPGPLKQRNKSHKTGKHRSKKELSRINKDSKESKIKPELNLSSKQSRFLKKKQKILQKQNRIKLYHSKVGYNDAPIAITVISSDKCFTIDSLMELFKLNDVVVNSTNSYNSFYISSETKNIKIQLLIPDDSNIFHLYDSIMVSQAIWLLSMDHNDEINESLMNMLNIFKFVNLPIIYHIKKVSNQLNSRQHSKLKKEYEKKLNQFIRLENRFFIFSEEKMVDNLFRLCVPTSSFNSKKIISDENAAKETVNVITDFINFAVSPGNETGVLSITGYLRGGSISANGYVHLPGYGDFPILQINQASLQMSTSKDSETQVSSYNTSNLICSRDSAIVEYIDLAHQTLPEEPEDLIKNAKIKSDQLLFDPIELTDQFQSISLHPQLSTPSSDETDSEIEDEFNNKNTEIDANNASSIPARFKLNEYQDMAKILDSWNDRMKGPPEYSKIIRFSNFSHASKVSLNSTQNNPASAGKYISIDLGGVPLSSYATIFSTRQYPVAHVLYPNEEKMTVCNYFIFKKEDTPTVYSNKKYIFICSGRRFLASCIFSAASKASKHKFLSCIDGEAYLVATLYAPVTFPPSNVLMFDQEHNGELSFIGSGHVLRPDPSRLILSQNILEGAISKVFKKSVIVRNMFDNREDVEHFIGCKLVTKSGTKGHILKPIGTHGNMRCFFDLPSLLQESVQMPLYRREYPIWDIDMAI